jgi:hypothetical protein
MIKFSSLSSLISQIHLKRRIVINRLSRNSYFNSSRGRIVSTNSFLFFMKNLQLNSRRLRSCFQYNWWKSVRHNFQRLSPQRWKWLFQSSYKSVLMSWIAIPWKRLNQDKHHPRSLEHTTRIISFQMIRVTFDFAFFPIYFPFQFVIFEWLLFDTVTFQNDCEMWNCILVILFSEAKCLQENDSFRLGGRCLGWNKGFTTFWRQINGVGIVAIRRFLAIVRERYFPVNHTTQPIRDRICFRSWEKGQR